MAGQDRLAHPAGPGPGGRAVGVRASRDRGTGDELVQRDDAAVVGVSISGLCFPLAYGAPPASPSPFTGTAFPRARSSLLSPGGAAPPTARLRAGVGEN